MNQETITDTLSWCKILPLSGFNPVRVKQRLHMRRKKGLLKFLETSHKPRVIYTVITHWNVEKCEDPAWHHRTSTPHRSETNDIAERVFRRVKEGTSAVLLQSGFDGRWWSDSVECYCCLRNVQDLLTDGKTLYKRRFGESFKKPIIPFGAMVEYHQ